MLNLVSGKDTESTLNDIHREQTAINAAPPQAPINSLKGSFDKVEKTSNRAVSISDGLVENFSKQS